MPTIEVNEVRLSNPKKCILYQLYIPIIDSLFRNMDKLYFFEIIYCKNYFKYNKWYFQRAHSDQWKIVFVNVDLSTSISYVLIATDIQYWYIYLDYKSHN